MIRAWVRGWGRSRASLLAELVEAREQAAQYADWLALARQQRDEAAREREEAVRKLAAAERRIAGLTDTIKVLAEPDQMVKSAEPRTPTAELLAERARADALAERLHELTLKSIGG